MTVEQWYLFKWFSEGMGHKSYMLIVLVFSLLTFYAYVLRHVEVMSHPTHPSTHTCSDDYNLHTSKSWIVDWLKKKDV